MPRSGRVRWGILGTGGINERFLAHVRDAPNAEFVAVGSRTAERARAFSARHSLARAHGSYEALLADPEVDVIYNCLPNGLHHEWTMEALGAGKHVLCEKPYSRHAADVMEAFDTAEAAGLHLMEGFMWRHTPQARRFVELLPEIGTLQAIRATFSFRIANRDDVRLRADLDGGSLMDVGCYCVSGIRLAAAAEANRVHAEQSTGESGVDLHFPGDVTATLVAGFHSSHASLEAIGERASLLLPNPWTGSAPALLLEGREIAVEPQDPYRLEVENLSAAILGEAEQLLGRADALGQASTIEALYAAASTAEPEMVAG
ncbi:MAG: Gfo/Idh/MocA family oxidoreductase [Chloroflexi bacterium]|nr:MAG: Gfo/Idh/MocA family oxidoreductase [Chloroflexota bacterium]